MQDVPVLCLANQSAIQIDAGEIVHGDLHRSFLPCLRRELLRDKACAAVLIHAFRAPKPAGLRLEIFGIFQLEKIGVDDAFDGTSFLFKFFIHRNQRHDWRRQLRRPVDDEAVWLQLDGRHAVFAQSALPFACRDFTPCAVAELRRAVHRLVRHIHDERITLSVHFQHVDTNGRIGRLRRCQRLSVHRHTGKTVDFRRRFIDCLHEINAFHEVRAPQSVSRAGVEHRIERHETHFMKRRMDFRTAVGAIFRILAPTEALKRHPDRLAAPCRVIHPQAVFSDGRHRLVLYA